ncbi:PLP-dependent aminotransferase family protein [Xylanibacillus composti]|uniref:Aminotransferase n=1 Tax=Xylanibacillus composti TaxID=1572762 RepID=A0A8J4H9E7_9BACL|nr:PLP-dependent aminotransferase family protein [Xylanibacillus composti]MDT9727216.1 PLP-dependent aminotransferase family protein [Xylanibacillus composti]GIQ71313.1 aminotransferase [Xylanibacillus composti]
MAQQRTVVEQGNSGLGKQAGRVRFAKRTDRMKASEIREILKLMAQPDFISFAGGIPDPDLFPVEEVRIATERVLQQSFRTALQYAPTEGYGPLREWIAAYMNETFGLGLEGADVLITSGSQQGLDLIGKLLLDEGDVVLCESPTYLGAIQAFQPYNPRFIEIETDNDGMIPESLESTLAAYPEAKLLYAVPNYQNPTGRTWSLERRKRVMEIAARYAVTVVEDDPYGELRFEGDRLPPLQAFDQQGQVMYLGSFSKVLCPGYRVGWTAAPKVYLEKMVLAKQGVDLHTSSINQMIIYEMLQQQSLSAYVSRLIGTYKERRDAMAGVLREKLPELKFQLPQGGLFLWGELPEQWNCRTLLENGVQHKIAFVPGGSFYPNGGHEHTMRLNYSLSDEQRIREGVGRLAALIHSTQA